MTSKIAAGSTFPQITLPAVGGGTVALHPPDGAWRMVVVYRGAHCPICKRYLATLEGLKAGFEALDIDVVAVSADPEEKASAEVAELGLTVPVGYALTLEHMRTLGLYISSPRSPLETDRPFSEPGVFVINAQGNVQVVDISNAPFARPDPEGILNGLKFVRDNDYPVRGTAA